MYECPGGRVAASEGGRRGMDDERFLNSYHNASTPHGPDVPADLAGFMLAADPILGEAAGMSDVADDAARRGCVRLCRVSVRRWASGPGAGKVAEG